MGIAAIVLAVHITAGMVALVSGGVALSTRKGSQTHRRAGHWFVVSMLAMSGLGAVAAALLPQRISVVAGMLTFYLVATGWMTLRRTATSAGAFEIGACAVALVIAIAGIAFGLQAAANPDGLLDRLPAPPSFAFAACAVLAAIGDARMIARGGIAGFPRIARHVWRMCVALLIAALSFFLGQQNLFPAGLRGSPVLVLPEIAILVVMAVWLVRLRARQRAARVR